MYIAIQDKAAYKQEIEWQLRDKCAYVHLHADTTMKFSDEIKSKLKRALSGAIINDKEYEYLLQANPLRTVIYTLPKIHMWLDNPPGRPFVSHYQNVTEPPNLLTIALMTWCRL